MKSIEIDRAKQLKDEPHTGHNRWHPDIPAIVEAEEGEEVTLQTRDAIDGQFSSNTTEADFSLINSGAIHPLTGPVLIKGAEPGDLPEVEFLDIVPEPWAFSAVIRGSAFCGTLSPPPSFTLYRENSG